MKTVFGINNEGICRPKRKHEEASLQARLITDLRIALPRDAFVFAVPNGGKRGVIEASNFKRQGVVAGVPDLIFVYRGKAFGLELKSKGGKLGDSQRATFPLLQNAGMRIEVARSHPEAIERLKEFGIPLRIVEDDKYGARDAFREDTKRGRA